MIVDDGGSGLAFYTDEEVLESIESGFELSDSELEERVEEGLEEYLESDLHFRIVQTKIDLVIEDNPDILFDSDDMEDSAENAEDVRDKFNSLWELNINSENELINTGQYLTPNHARYKYRMHLANFMWQYAHAVRGNLDNTEKDLIIQLRTIIFRELGFTSNLGEAFGKGISGGASAIGEGVGNVVSFITEDIVVPALKGLFKGAGKYIIIGVIALIAVGIGYAGVKTYAVKKIKSRK